MDSLQYIADHYGTDAALLVCGLRHISAGHAEAPKPVIPCEAVSSSADLLSRIMEHDLPPSILGSRSLSDCLSTDSRCQFIDLHRGRALRALARSGEMASVSKKLKQEGFEVRFWKGSALSMLLYGDLTSRPTRDIDLLIKQEELMPIRECLLELGYKDVILLEDPIIPGYMSFHREWVMHRVITGGENVYIELQTSPVMGWSIPRASMEMAFRGLDQLDLGGVMVPISDPGTHFLLVAAHHGFSEGWRQLRQVCDMVAFARLPVGVINWEEVLEIAQAMDLERPMIIGWGLARDLAGVRIPDAFRGRVERETRLIAMAKSRLFRSPLPLKSELTWDSVLWQWRLASNLRSRTRLVLGNFKKRFSPGYDEFRAISLPPGMFGLYYLMKPFRLFLKRMNTA